ncbi:hypothetical protein [Actinomycetospora sp.]|jgi:hypothetical protein|uniref:hypothetical protein n=1 Tax=Actinomycetospora sp. TaxID=1872135 RepID=UPI002F409481
MSASDPPSTARNSPADIGGVLAAAFRSLLVIRRPAELLGDTVIAVIWPIEIAAVVMNRAVEGDGTGRMWTLLDPTPDLSRGRHLDALVRRPDRPATPGNAYGSGGDGRDDSSQ